MGRKFGSALGCALLAVASGDEQLPTEFRLFKAGWNVTENGKYLFDDQAAAEVMANYRAHQVDRMIDLEHLSVDETAPNYDPDARGWCRLELRNGELWAVGVTWNEDGAARLRSKRQRYVSPAFEYDTATRRVASILNIALTALPATHGTRELVAASVRKSATGVNRMMDAKLVKEALDAVEAGDEGKAMEILKGLVASAASGGSEPPPDAPAEETLATDEPPPDEEKKDEEEEGKEAAMAAVARLTRITQKPTIGAAVDEVETWRESHLALESERAKLAKERNALEAGERRRLVGELVKLGAEIPATAWKDSKGTVPSERLQREPLAELRARVTAMLSARGGKFPSDPRPPKVRGTGGDDPSGADAVELSDRELAKCRDKKIDPAAYAKTKAAIRERNARAN